MIKEVKIDTIEKVKDLVFDTPYNPEIDRTRSSYFYRGLPNSSYKLLTSLSRNCKDKSKDLEQPLLDNFIKYMKIEDPTIDDSIWKAMVIGQHYGLPTRLLDWTHSVLIALHFATTEDNLDNMNDHDCVIWRIDMRDLNNNLPENYQQYLRDKRTFVFSLDGLASIANDIKTYDDDMGENSIVCFEPPSIDQRIANQYSFFSVIPKDISDLEKFLDQKTTNTVKYIIDKNLRWKIRDILDQFNINERMVYPGKAGISKWLARHYFVKKK